MRIPRKLKKSKKKNKIKLLNKLNSIAKPTEK